MSLIAVSIPNLISGVSQQPHTLRLASTCDALENGWPSVVSGLSKRPPTQHIAKIDFPGGIPANATAYMIDRENGYQYIVIVSDDEVRVYNLDGVQQTVTYPQGKSYIEKAVNPTQDFRFVTLGDTTFILNRKVRIGRDDYGEIGAANFTPDYTVATAAALPGSATAGQIALVDNTQRYYSYVTTASRPAITTWVANGAAVTSPGNPFPTLEVVTVLPKTAVAGKQVVLKTITTGASRQVWVNNVQNDNGGGGQYETRVTTSTTWRRYTGTVTQTAQAASSNWVLQSESQLAKTVFGRINPTGRWTVTVNQAIANINYNIYINGTLKASYTTAKGFDVATSVPGTDVIAKCLSVGLNATNGTSAANLTSSGVSHSIVGSTLCLALSASDKVVVTTSSGDKAMKAYGDAVNQFSDLPPNELEGRIVKVKGSMKDNGDDYYVKFSDGVWTETNGWNTGESPLASSMPHKLVRQADGTWTFTEHTWNGRASGDTVSNPSPSFVGQVIQDMFLYSGRLGFVASENVILSEVGVLENFYRSTMTTLVDSDPIDMAVLNSGSDELYHAVPFNKDLLLMSDNRQYRFAYSNYLGPKNIEVHYTTAFSVSRFIKPYNMGNSVYFVDDKPGYNYAKVWEYYPKDNQSGDDADDVTSPVPEYLQSGIKFLAASTRMKCLITNSQNEPNKLYAYRFYWNGERKVQNAWGTWTFPDCTNIYWAGFTGNWLYLLMQRNGEIFLERMSFSETVTRNEISSRILTDRQLSKPSLSLSFNASEGGVLGTTTITLPYATSVVPEVVASWYNADPEQQTTDVRSVVTKVSNTVVKVAGDLTGASLVTVGVGYSFLYRFNTPYLRQAKGNGEVVVLDGTRLQLRYMTIEYHDTAYFQTRLRYPGREDVITTFDGKVTGDATFIVGATPFISGKFRVALFGNNKDCKFELLNDSPYNCSFGGAEWNAVYAPRVSPKARS